jgi:hypothetical protein
MALQISISDSIVQALRLPEQRIEQELRRELAIALDQPKSSCCYKLGINHLKQCLSSTAAKKLIQLQ